MTELPVVNLDAEKLIYSARLLLDEKQAGEAASLLQECILRYPDEGKAYALMGHICSQHFREPLSAETYFEKAMLLAADFTETYLFYADLLLSQERYTEMTAILNKGLETTAAEKNKIYFLFGLMNERQSKFEEAVENYQRAIIYCTNDEDLTIYNKSINRCLTKQKTFNI